MTRATNQKYSPKDSGFRRILVATDDEGKVRDSLALVYDPDCRETPPEINVFLKRNSLYQIHSGIADSVAGFLAAYPQIRRPRLTPR